MRRRTTLAVGAAVAIAAALIPLTALAKTYSDAVHGAEYYATTVDGKFVGVATGALPGAWRADVQHAALAPSTVSITGGTFQIQTVVNGQIHTVVGQFTNSGTITPTGGFGTCGTQTFSVRGPLAHVGVFGQPDNGSGIFQATLTHYQFSFFGACVTYAATVNGSVSLSF